MKIEEQNIAIAVAVGTHTVRREMRSWNPHVGMPAENIYVLIDSKGRESFQWIETVSGSTTDNDFDYPPRYTGDLNACHEMEKVLTDIQWTDYANVLTDVAPCSRRGMIHATAPQRCESFLKTLSLWTP